MGLLFPLLCAFFLFAGDLLATRKIFFNFPEKIAARLAMLVRTLEPDTRGHIITSNMAGFHKRN